MFWKHDFTLETFLLYQLLDFHKHSNTPEQTCLLVHTHTHLLRAVGIIHEVAHCDKRVAEGFCRCDSFVCIQAEHPLQEVYKLSSIGLLSQHVGPLQMRRQVDLEVTKRTPILLLYFNVVTVMSWFVCLN